MTYTRDEATTNTINIKPFWGGKGSGRREKCAFVYFLQLFFSIFLYSFIMKNYLNKHRRSCHLLCIVNVCIEAKGNVRPHGATEIIDCHIVLALIRSLVPNLCKHCVLHARDLSLQILGELLKLTRTFGIFLGTLEYTNKHHIVIVDVSQFSCLLNSIERWTR